MKFANQMDKKMFEKLKKGYHGWDNPRYKKVIKEKLMEHTKELIAGDNRQAVDVANLAMMLWAKTKPA